MAEDGARPAPVPGHAAIIMDGNGRWARQRGLPREAGHREGARSVRDIVRACREWGVRALTLYAFSWQNWDRPSAEVEALMGLLAEFLADEREEILTNQIRLHAIGRLHRIPAPVRTLLDALMAESAGNQGMILTLALSYGGRESIVDAVNHRLASGFRHDTPAPVTEEELTGLLPTGILPPVDLVIRTSGELRVSNFLLWECAYAEFFFTPTLWPDFRRAELRAVFEDFSGRQRRYGQVSPPSR
ncbi:MAG: Isoprenyl transferase [Myxococcota bacterium]|nr:Isoprenyl transferase [Myxococcota bacterium]